MYLLPAQLCRESTPQVVPDQTTLIGETKRNSRSFTGFLKTASEVLTISSDNFLVAYYLNHSKLSPLATLASCLRERGIREAALG